MRKIYVVGGSNSYANWMQGELVDSLEEADLVVATGGEDISSYLYGEPQGQHTYNNKERDKAELVEFRKAIELGIPILGICRGSQYCAVLAGASLIQHQENPYSIHNIKTSTGEVIPITSSHHQAQNPYVLPKEEYEVLAWTEDISTFHLNGLEQEVYVNGEKEVEICHYPKIKALAVQGHP